MFAMGCAWREGILHGNACAKPHCGSLSPGFDIENIRTRRKKLGGAEVVYHLRSTPGCYMRAGF